MMSVHDRVYRSLLSVYPEEHRREYGEPMAQLVRDRFRDEGGGARSAVLWVRVAGDLFKTALAERKVAAMDTWKDGWWRISAGLMAIVMVGLGIGNLFADDPGPMSGKIFAASLAVVAALLIVAGLRVRKTRLARGSTMIGVGVLPGVILVVVVWFLPVFLGGVLAVVTAAAAFSDAIRRGRATAA